jgi:hypothetical protein
MRQAGRPSVFAAPLLLKVNLVDNARATRRERWIDILPMIS